MSKAEPIDLNHEQITPVESWKGFWAAKYSPQSNLITLPRPNLQGDFNGLVREINRKNTEGHSSLFVLGTKVLFDDGRGPGFGVEQLKAYVDGKTKKQMRVAVDRILEDADTLKDQFPVITLRVQRLMGERDYTGVLHVDAEQETATVSYDDITTLGFYNSDVLRALSSSEVEIRSGAQPFRLSAYAVNRFAGVSYPNQNIKPFAHAAPAHQVAERSFLICSKI